MKTFGKALVSVLLVVVFVVLAIRYGGIDFAQVAESMKKFSPIVVGVALLSSAAQIAFMVLRFWSVAGGISLSRCSYAYLMGHLANNFAPARAGEALKIALLSRGPEARPVLVITGVFASDRVVDLGCFLTIVGLTAVFFGSQLKLPELTPTKVFSIAGFILVLAAIGFFVFRKYSSVLKPRWQEFKSGMAPLAKPVVLAQALAFSLGCWVAEVAALGLLTYGLGYNIGFGGLVTVLIALNLAISVAVSIANIGTFEAGVALALIPLGVAKEDAIAIAILHHALQLVSILFLASVRILTSLRTEQKQTAI